MRHLPQRAQTTEIVEWDGGRCRRRLDDLTGEEPLEIRINGSSIGITMRTAGDDFELAVGFLVTEGILTRHSAVERVAYGRGVDREVSGNIVDVTIAGKGW
jgi:FdhD protein